MMLYKYLSISSPPSPLGFCSEDGCCWDKITISHGRMKRSLSRINTHFQTKPFNLPDLYILAGQMVNTSVCTDSRKCPRSLTTKHTHAHTVKRANCGKPFETVYCILHSARPPHCVSRISLFLCSFWGQLSSGEILALYWVTLFVPGLQLFLSVHTGQPAGPFNMCKYVCVCEGERENERALDKQLRCVSMNISPPSVLPAPSCPSWSNNQSRFSSCYWELLVKC